MQREKAASLRHFGPLSGAIYLCLEVLSYINISRPTPESIPSFLSLFSRSGGLLSITAHNPLTPWSFCIIGPFSANRSDSETSIYALLMKSCSPIITTNNYYLARDARRPLRLLLLLFYYYYRELGSLPTAELLWFINAALCGERRPVLRSFPRYMRLNQVQNARNLDFSPAIL